MGGIIRLDSLTINGSSFYVEMPKNKTLIGVHFDRDYGRTGKPDGYSYFVSEYEDEITVRDNKNNRIVKIPVKINFQWFYSLEYYFFGDKKTSMVVGKQKILKYCTHK